MFACKRFLFQEWLVSIRKGPCVDVVELVLQIGHQRNISLWVVQEFHASGGFEFAALVPLMLSTQSLSSCYKEIGNP